MKLYLALIALTIITFKGFSQDSIPLQAEKNEGKDIIIFDLFTDLWQNIPAVAENRTINQGISICAILNLPIGHSNLSFSGGLGLSSHNFYSNTLPVLGRNAANQLNGTTEFIKLEDYYGRKIDYSINKLNITYIEIPIEIRFKTRANRNKRIRASFGGKIGYNISNHTRYRGEDVIENTTDAITLKKSDVRYLNDVIYGITARIGYGRYNVMAFYSLSKTFEKGKGPQMYPISLGISIIPF